VLVEHRLEVLRDGEVGRARYCIYVMLV
jgi:hypothetical protein